LGRSTTAKKNTYRCLPHLELNVIMNEASSYYWFCGVQKIGTKIFITKLKDFMNIDAFRQPFIVIYPYNRSLQDALFLRFI
jgi:hypothetical protein